MCDSFGVLSAFRFDLLDICINGPKEKLDSTVISQVWTSLSLLNCYVYSTNWLSRLFLDFRTEGNSVE